jgi:hypothetical protein
MLFSRVNGQCAFRVGSEEKSSMVRFRSALLMAILVVTAAAAAGGAVSSGSTEALCGSEGQHAKSITLNGTWEFAVGDGQERAESQEGQAKLVWQEVRLPGQFMPWSEKAVSEIAFVWARRTFQLTAEQAKSLAVLRWNYVSLGAAAFVNERKVGQNEPAGPYQAIIPPGVLQAGENEIVLKIAGTRGARRAASGYFLFPAGFASTSGMPSVTDDVWIDFADRAYMKWALAIADLARSKVTIRVTPSGLEKLDGLTIRARVRPWRGGDFVGEGQAQGRLVPDANPLGG